jgi:hypothetical protein
MSTSTPGDRSAGASPAVAGATRPRFGEITIRERGRLPHWEKDNATYFVTSASLTLFRAPFSTVSRPNAQASCSSPGSNQGI